MSIELTGAEFRDLFQQGPGCNLVLSPYLTIVGVSNEYLRATMTERSAIVGRHLFEVFPDNPDDLTADGVSNLRASLERVLSGRRPDSMAPQKYDIRQPDGTFEERYWSPVNRPILGTGEHSDEVEYIVHSVTDITDYMRLKKGLEEGEEQNERLAERTSELELELFKRARELEVANDSLREADASRSDFLSRVSHELRTPLTAVIGFGELLHLAELEPEHQEWVTTILRAARHLLELLNDVLDIARVDGGTLAISVEPVPLRTLLDQTLEIVRPLAASNGISLEADMSTARSIYIPADVQRMRQVLLNLMSNAVKYNRPNGKVTLSVSSSQAPEGQRRFQGNRRPTWPYKATGQRMYVSVTDEGRGLTDEQLQKLFVPFERLGAAAEGIEGTGLGLVLAQQLTKAMGGELHVESVPGQGSTFSVSFPAVEPLATADTLDFVPAIVSRSYPDRKIVMYVEDVSANIRLVEEILKRRPMIDLLPVMSGAVALELAQSRPPDLVLLDLHLPDMDGEEVLRRLRANEATADVPVVVLSADATRPQLDRLMSAGANSYLTKPISVATLLDSLDHLLDPADSRET